MSKNRSEFQPTENASTLDDGDGAEGTVVLIFEVPQDMFPLARPHFDRIIARFGLTCHVHFEENR